MDSLHSHKLIRYAKSVRWVVSWNAARRRAGSNAPVPEYPRIELFRSYRSAYALWRYLHHSAHATDARLYRARRNHD